MPFASPCNVETRRSCRKIARDWRWFLCNQVQKRKGTDTDDYSMHYFQPKSRNVDSDFMNIKIEYVLQIVIFNQYYTPQLHTVFRVASKAFVGK